MKEKLSEFIKHFPAVTAICYVCGFIVFKSFLLQHGIVETDIINIRFIEAGIIYLLIAPFILATQFITNKKLTYLGSVFTAVFAFHMYNIVIGSAEWNFLWKALLVVVILNSWSFLIWSKYAAEKERKLFDLTESPLAFFVLVLTSLTVFSVYFNKIKSNFGGGQIYKKILVLKEKQNGLLKTDSLNRTDTLIIIYENREFLYFIEGANTKSLSKDLIIGEILLKK